MERTLRFLPLVAIVALCVATTVASAQRPSETLYISARGGAIAYGGELDGTGSAPAGDDSGSLAWMIRDLGFGGGGEIGYQFTRALSFGIGFFYGQYNNLDRTNALSPVTLQAGQINAGTSVSQLQGLFRFNLIPGWKVSPYIQFGGVVIRGQGEDPRSGNRIAGYGPHLGGGLDILLGRQVSLFLEGSGSLIFPDDAVDSSDPSANSLPWADDADYDALTFYGGGLRFFFKGAGVNVDVMADCSSELIVGQNGSFTASSNADASQPVSYSWNFGDGTTGSGMTALHAFSAPGSYTVSFSAEGPYNSDTDTCLVNVAEVAEAPTASCRVSPSRTDIGQTITVSGNITGSEPSVSVHFGDGSTASSLPATHNYSAPGTYLVTVTATNAAGSDSSTCTVTVLGGFCEEVAELNTVFFDYQMNSLSSEGRGRLDENIGVLSRCPDICIVIDGYADDQERDKLRLSERRADEVQAYYVANGIDASRIVSRGLGEHPDSNSKEDPGPGDRNARRSDSIPVDCSRLGGFN